jgi:hypothetical protein
MPRWRICLALKLAAVLAIISEMVEEKLASIEQKSTSLRAMKG